MARIGKVFRTIAQKQIAAIRAAAGDSSALTPEHETIMCFIGGARRH
jgi:hypothetical protein